MSFAAKGLLVVVSGPSGCGKSTLCRKVLKGSNHEFGLVVSHTSRAMREGEENKVDYHFLSRDEFEANIEQDRYLEWARVHDNYYGTPKDQVEQILAEGKNVMLEIDVQGGLQVKEKVPASLLLFVSPPKFETLEERLTSRATDSREIIEKRLKNAVAELQRIPDYEYLVINDELDEAVIEFESVLTAASLSIKRVDMKALSSALKVPISRKDKKSS